VYHLFLPTKKSRKYGKKGRVNLTRLFLRYFQKSNYLRVSFSSRVTLSQDWLPTVQLVLQADWQVLRHSPQAVTFFSWGFAIVLIIIFSPYKLKGYDSIILLFLANCK
jgi:hypothetical protein